METEAIVKLPDGMGVWSEDATTVWLPHDHYPARHLAIRWAMDQWGVTFPEVRCRVSWMRYTPHVVEDIPAGEGLPLLKGHTEDLWTECDPGEPGAFRVWRVE